MCTNAILYYSMNLKISSKQYMSINLCLKHLIRFYLFKIVYIYCPTNRCVFFLLRNACRKFLSVRSDLLFDLMIFPINSLEIHRVLKIFLVEYTPTIQKLWVKIMILLQKVSQTLQTQFDEIEK